MAGERPPDGPTRAARLGLAALVVIVGIGAANRRVLEPRLPDGLLVEVVGDVRRPGVHLVEVATVGAALAAAGGPDVSAAGGPNAAALGAIDIEAHDGPQDALIGGTRVTVGDAIVLGPASDPLLLGHRIDVNVQAASVLQDLPGVGPSTAGAILDHRLRYGPFRSVDELAWVRGIGPATLDDLRPLVGVGDVAPREPRGPVDVNVATVAQLERLPGIGPTRAAAIVADRLAHGPFAEVAALDRVRGIGPATVAGLGDAAVAR